MSPKLEELADRLAPLIADRVVAEIADRLELEANRPEPEPVLVDAATVAERFAVTRDYVYEHADELGAIRLGAGPRARLRFDLERVAEAIGARPQPATDPYPPRKAPRRRPAGVPLLPIRGQKP